MPSELRRMKSWLLANGLYRDTAAPSPASGSLGGEDAPGPRPRPVFGATVAPGLALPPLGTPPSAHVFGALGHPPPKRPIFGQLGVMPEPPPERPAPLRFGPAPGPSAVLPGPWMGDPRRTLPLDRAELLRPVSYRGAVQPVAAASQPALEHEPTSRSARQPEDPLEVAQSAQSKLDGLGAGLTPGRSLGERALRRGVDRLPPPPKAPTPAPKPPSESDVARLFQQRQPGPGDHPLLNQRLEDRAPPEVLAYADAMADHYKIPRSLFRSQIAQESQWKPSALSDKGAQGYTQLMPGTAGDLKVDPKDWRQNIEGRARYLAEQKRRFGRWDLALAAYNAGPTNAQTYGRDWSRYPRPETGTYVTSITQRNGGFLPSD